MQRVATVTLLAVSMILAWPAASAVAHDKHSGHKHSHHKHNQKKHHPKHNRPKQPGDSQSGNEKPPVIVDPIRPKKIVEVRDHRDGAGGQGGTTVTNNGFPRDARDHRSPAGTKGPIIRDHRTAPVVRDHRSQ
jgi:hypothetical protein